MVSGVQLNKIGRMWVGILISLLQGNRPYPKYATGKLQRSLQFKHYRNEDGNIVIQLLSAKGDNGYEYLKVVDGGRKPGKYAPINALKKWARIKGMDEGAAYAINKKIFKEGIKATFVINKSIEQLFSTQNEELFRGIEEEIVSDLIDKFSLTFKKV
jgi:hypothetical protein